MDRDITVSSVRMKRKSGYFSISAVAKMFSVHQQTIRLYEKEGLITPKRTEGNTRMFTEEDVNRLEEIIYLTHQLGINLAGVQMVLKLQRQVKRMQKDMNKLFKEAQDELAQETEISKTRVTETARKLLMLRKKEQQGHRLPVSKQPKPSETGELEEWQVEYDE